MNPNHTTTTAEIPYFEINLTDKQTMDAITDGSSVICRSIMMDVYPNDIDPDALLLFRLNLDDVGNVEQFVIYMPQDKDKKSSYEMSLAMMYITKLARDLFDTAPEDRLIKFEQLHGRLNRIEAVSDTKIEIY